MPQRLDHHGADRALMSFSHKGTPFAHLVAGYRDR
jgi:hypothetical protein